MSAATIHCTFLKTFLRYLCQIQRFSMGWLWGREEGKVNILNPRRDFFPSVTSSHIMWPLLLHMNQWLNAGKCRNVNHESTERKDFTLPFSLCCREYVLSESQHVLSPTPPLLEQRASFTSLRVCSDWPEIYEQKPHCDSVTTTVSAFAVLDDSEVL